MIVSSKPIPVYLRNFSKRNKSMNPSWMLGTGVDLGHLQPYARPICLAILVRTFYKELSDDMNRTRQDLIRDVLDIITNEMNLECTYDLAEKFIESMMWSRSKKFAAFSFEDIWFNEETKKWETQRYQFFKLDREVSDLSIGYEVYQLSEESQEIVLKSQEIMEELDVNIQQLVAEMFIRKGNFKSALQALDTLRVHVRRLIGQEKELRETIRKNPKQVLFEQKQRWGRQLEDVKEQFQQELNQYTKMEKAIDRMKNIEDQEVTVQHLLGEILKTKRLHDALAKIVIENIQLEIEFRAKWYFKLWAIPSPSFKDVIWEQSVRRRGLRKPDDMFQILEGMFSPKKGFIFPLEWMVIAQEDSNVISFESAKESKQKELIPLSLDWRKIVKLWKPFFYQLLTYKRIQVQDLVDLDKRSISEWVNCREAFDIWLSFASMEEDLVLTEDKLKSPTDDKILLIKKLIEEDPVFKELFNCTISTRNSLPHSIWIDGRIEVFPYEIYIKEGHVS